MPGWRTLNDKRQMKNKSIANAFDIAVLAVVVILNPLLSYKSIHMGIPDKVEILVHQQPTADSAIIGSKLHELQYYLRTHNVTDEGYNLIAQYNTLLTSQAKTALKADKDSSHHRILTPPKTTTRYIKAKDRLLPAVKTCGGYWKSGHFRIGKVNGPAILRDWQGRIVCAMLDADTVVTATRTDSTGTYRGQMNSDLMACGQGTFDATDGTHYEGLWQDDQQHGFGFEVSAHHQVRVGQWKEGRFLGERLAYTAERIYGIDISRYQHEKGRKRYAINWQRLRITSLGKKHATGGQTFPVSFVYIKSTEGTCIRNRYFLKDYSAARRQGIRVGAYHFFSVRTSASAQANYFISSTLFRKGDFPPVLDVEPTHSEVQQMGGADELMSRIRTFLSIVERRTGMRPILYVSQSFVNRYMQNASDIKSKYNVWIARYGEYKPDVKLVYWQLAADGRVSGITGEVDINVFNGYQGQWDEFIRTGFHK